jgi:hypothetical protein
MAKSPRTFRFAPGAGGLPRASGANGALSRPLAPLLTLHKEQGT